MKATESMPGGKQLLPYNESRGGTILMESYNVTGFLILGFSDLWCCKGLVQLLLAFIYSTTTLSNCIILWVILLDHQLHTPMYFFLGNLAFLDIAYTTVTIPKMLAILITEDRSISYTACIAQLYFYVSLEGSEAFLLMAMAYDRYIAICSPLHYKNVMKTKVCILLAAVSWICGGINASIHTILTFSLSFCNSHDINHLFCDIPPLLQLSCQSSFINELILFTVGGVWVGLGPFLLIVISYIYISATIRKLHSAEGRRKTFSTCSAHITVVALFFGSSLFTYIHPPSRYTSEENKVVSVLYSLLTPMLNPLIYSLRNDSVKEALQKARKHLLTSSS
ncbi:olfactory receptor 5V1-like [Hyperolius riggenbachi]|uniref:olfactory receptor 5V1-like n=1 Tax=Hyperolius riggenbachi TaxID=752182 RepID=UPI0035A352DC